MGRPVIDFEENTMRNILSFLSVLCILTGSSYAIPVNKEFNKDDSLDQYLRAILEEFRNAMTVGIPEINIPVLDPFEVPHFDIPHIEEGPVKADITIDDFIIKNLASFETTNVHLDPVGLSLELELLIPLLRGDAVYSLDGNILSIFPLFGDGPMYIELSGLAIKGAAGVTIDGEGKVQVTDLTLGADFQGAVIHLDNLVGGGDFGDVINNLLSALAPTIWDQFKDFVFDDLNKLLTSIINNELGKCPIQDIISGDCELQTY